MADLSDVETALVALILGAAAPGGSEYPVLGCSPVRVFRGAPPVTALTRDRSAGVVDISILPIPNATRNTTRWGVQSATVSVAAGLSATVNGQSATFAGRAVMGETAGVLVNDAPFVYSAQAGDSASLVAAALADLVRATQICWLQGATLTIPAAITLIARSAGVASILQEWARQEQDSRISIWGTSPQTRDSVCNVLSVVFAQTPFLTLADGSAGRIRYEKTANYDDDQVASIYRREMVFSVEYGTTTTSPSPTMLFGDLVYNATPTYV